MAAPGTVYNAARLAIASGQLNLSTADVRVMWVNSSYTPNYDTHQYVSSAVANEVATNGIARIALANKALTQDNTLDRAKFDCDDIETAAVTTAPTSVRRMLVYNHTGNDATALLIASILLDDTAGGTDVTPIVGQKIRYTVNANGLFNI